MEKTKNKGGAPLKTDTEKRIRRLELRLTEDEYRQLNARRASTKIKDSATFIRMVCLEKPLPVKPQLSSYQEKLLSMIFEMQQDIRRIGVNVNQSTKRINATTDYQDLQREVTSMSSNLDSLSAQIESLFVSVNPQTAINGNPD